MKSHETNAASRFGPLLAQREAELRAILRGVLVANSQPSGNQEGVKDFKDIAAESSRDTVDEVQADHAALELQQVLAALQRIDDGSYGQCLDCGDPIDERRLTAMPAAAYCVACQGVHEHARPH